MKQIIEALSNLSLMTNPYTEAKQLIGKLNKYGLIETTFHPGKVIIRARPNKPGERFFSKPELSYKPAKFNTTYQRASTPEMTMFYGCVIPEKIAPGEPETSRVTAVFEASNLQREDADGEEVITFGKWVVTKPFSLITVVHGYDYTKKSIFATELNEVYLAEVNKMPNEFRENSVIVSDFFAREFSKLKITHHTDYLLSAIFTEHIIARGRAGVYYPSVRTEGAGFNVAIHPSVVDSCMELQAVGECALYKLGKHTMLDNNSAYILKNQDDRFDYAAITDPKYHTGRDTIEKILKGEIKI